MSYFAHLSDPELDQLIEAFSNNVGDGSTPTQSGFTSPQERRDDLESAIGALFRSGADIGTFGAAPKISAGLGTLGALVTRPELFKDQSLPDIYSNAYDIAKQQQQQSLSNHPIASLLGGLGVIPGLISGGVIPAEATAGNLAKTGAMYGVGSSDYDSFGNLAKDVGKNAALNLVLGKILGFIPKALGGESPQLDKNNFIYRSIQDARNKPPPAVAPNLPDVKVALGDKKNYTKVLTLIPRWSDQSDLQKYGDILYPEDPTKLGPYKSLKESNTDLKYYKPGEELYDEPLNSYDNSPSLYLRDRLKEGFLPDQVAANRNSNRSNISKQAEDKLISDFKSGIPGSWEKLVPSFENRTHDNLRKNDINKFNNAADSLINNIGRNGPWNDWQRPSESIPKFNNPLSNQYRVEMSGKPFLHDPSTGQYFPNNKSHINTNQNILSNPTDLTKIYDVDPSTLGNLKPNTTPFQDLSTRETFLPYRKQYKSKYSHNSNEYVPKQSFGDNIGNAVQKLDLTDPNKSTSTLSTLLTNNINGNPANLVDKIAQVESGGDPNAKSKKGTASGLLQFTNSTWKDAVSKYGDQTGVTIKDKNNPDAQRKIAELSLRDNGENLSKFLNRPPQQTELYLTHFLGLNGAKSLLSANPDQFAAKVLPDAAKANRSVFFKNGRPLTVSELYSNLDKKIQG